MVGRAPKWGASRLDRSRRNPGAPAKVSNVFGRIRGGLEWNWAFAPGRDTLAGIAADSMCRVDSISDAEDEPPPDSQVWPTEGGN